MRCRGHFRRDGVEDMLLCFRCGKRRAVESVAVGQDNIDLCVRCADTFWRRFQKFMAGG